LHLSPPVTHSFSLLIRLVSLSQIGENIMFADEQRLTEQISIDFGLATKYRSAE
jgi:hypothetical protein